LLKIKTRRLKMNDDPKVYEKPEVIYEQDLETRAGSVPEPNPFEIEE